MAGPVTASTGARPDDVPLIPRKLLLGNPVRTSPRLSPDGKRLAYVAPEEGVLNLWLAGEGWEAGAPGDDKAVTHDRGRGVQTFFWALDSRHLVYIQDSHGDENWHVFSLDPDVGVVRDLTPFIGIQGMPIAAVPERPGEMLVSLNLRDRTVHDVYRLDLETGAIVPDTENPGNIIGWLVDRHLRVRCGLARLPDGSTELRVRDEVGAPWRTLLLWGSDDEYSGAYGFSPDGTSLYLHDSQGAETQRLVRIDLATGTKNVLFEDPHHDVGGIITKPVTKNLQAVGVAADKSEWHVLDEEFSPDWKAMEQFAPGKEVDLVSRDLADRIWLVAIHSDVAPLAFYRFERATKAFTHLFDAQPELRDFTLAPMEPVHFPARDGLGLQGYLTLPPGTPGTALPMVLVVHGGPWWRDTWGLDPEAQLLANRGYAVLQVNFRGSIGFGKSFTNAGDREWGAKMHDDLLDAVDWAVARGIADRKRVAIMGGSYGGYAALVGATFTPDAFAAAIVMVGPSSLVTLIESIPPYWKPMRNTFDRRVGNIDTEKEFLESRSPLFRAGDIRIPLLIAQGANDPRVKVAEAEQIVAACRAKGKDVEYLLFPDEGHGCVRPENRLKYYATVESFLARHLGGRAEA
ncbi:MAG: S9 family peptidase [Candidatus Wallbacteria bacterium]|nr:S9 family peptidase [Candidatus Wallbacteria bacterium]